MCGAIFAAAGPGLAEACAELGGCADRATPSPPRGSPSPPAGSSTRSGRSGAAAAEGEAQLLASAYRRALGVADGLGAASISFPAISTGIFGYPLEAATAIAVGTCRAATPEHVRLVRFVCFDRVALEAYESELGPG